MNQLLCNKNYKSFRKDLKDGGCNSFTVYRDSNGVVHSDGDMDHETLSIIMKGILARERLKSSPELPPLPASWGELQQSDVRSYAAKVIEVFKQPGQKYGFDDMPLWDINVPVNELDPDTRRVIVIEENLSRKKFSLSEFYKWNELKGVKGIGVGPPKFNGLSKWTNFLRKHS